MESHKVITPMNTGVQKRFNWFKKLDVGLRRYEDKAAFYIFYEIGSLTH
jgi:hypothetical protein